MIRNYNGKVNRAILRDLWRLCDVNAKNLKSLLEAFAKNGEVSFYKNLCPFTGFPDEMSIAHTFTSEEKIREYLKSDAQERFDMYLHDKIANDDYLLIAILEFIKENGNCKYPNRAEMQKLECAAEIKRVAELPEPTTAEAPMTEQEVLQEIMDLAEEIFESRWLTNPKDIFCPVDPYYDRLYVEIEDFRGLIECNSHYRSGDCSDYLVKGMLKSNYDIDHVLISRCHDGTANASAEDWRGEIVDVEKEYLLSIHKSMVELAKREGITFTTEIDYEKIVA